MTSALARPLLLAVTFFGLCAIAIGACEQGEDDRCQVDGDCDSPLICNRATQTCSSASQMGIDATVPDIIDAIPEFDAPVDVIDAPPDMK